MRFAGAIAFLLFVAAPGAAQQSTAWTLSGGRALSTVTEARTAGYAALPATALVELGAEIGSAAGDVTVRLDGHEARLRPGSPFFTRDGELHQLVHSVYAQGGVVYLPLQFWVEHVPALSQGRIEVDVASRSIRAAPSGATAVARPAGAAPTANRPGAATPAPAPPAAATPAPQAAAPPPAAPKHSRRLVVLDAGHGGVDPGARGPGGVREKDVTLAVTRRLAAILRQDTAFDVRTTRDRDTLIALTDRTRKANSWRADGQEALFMSIHTNAHRQPSVRGFETFFLSEAKTEDARRVAEMENAAQRYENPSRTLDPMSFILQDLRQNRYLRDSSDWAQMIQNRLGAIHPGPNRGVKQAGFVVLNGAFMPAVLVELGFITHAAEERMLADPGHQERMAQQLAKAVRDFFEQSAAAGGR